jgi:hypothetical protein
MLVLPSLLPASSSVPNLPSRSPPIPLPHSCPLVTRIWFHTRLGSGPHVRVADLRRRIGEPRNVGGEASSAAGARSGNRPSRVRLLLCRGSLRERLGEEGEHGALPRSPAERDGEDGQSAAKRRRALASLAAAEYVQIAPVRERRARDLRSSSQNCVQAACRRWIGFSTGEVAEFRGL